MAKIDIGAPIKIWKGNLMGFTLIIHPAIMINWLNKNIGR